MSAAEACTAFNEYKALSELELSASGKIMLAMNSVPTYEELAGIMSAHVQRMICNKAQNAELEAARLYDEFHSQCLTKINYVTSLAAGKMPK